MLLDKVWDLLMKDGIATHLFDSGLLFLPSKHFDRIEDRVATESS